MKTAIVLGATGLIGQSLVKQLDNSANIQGVVSITRKPVEYESDKINNLVVDFDNLRNYASAFKGDLLFSALGTTIKQAGSMDAMRTVDLSYQLQAAEMAVSNGVDHYLLVSSANANSRSKSQYLKMKGQLEDKISALPFDRISIFQPSLLLGERDHYRIAETIGSKVAPLICSLPGLKRYRPIKGEEVAAKMIEVSNSSNTGLETYSLDQIFIE